MDRSALLELLASYTTPFQEEAAFVPRFISLIGNFPNCFSRRLRSGHVTGSAWVVSPDKHKAVLLHHKKLNRWLQPGGHADGEEDIRKVAGKELEEETGLTAYRWLSDHIFDLDIHLIPAMNELPSHFHFDIRFLAEGDPCIPLQANVESKGVAWVGLREINSKTGNERSIQRMVEKTIMLS